MSIFLYLIWTLAGHKLVMSPGSGAPRSSGVLYIKSSSDEHILYLICDTGRTQIGVRVQGAEPQEAQGFYTLHHRQMSIFYTLFVTLAGHKLVLGPGSGAPRSSGVLYIQSSSDEHILYLIL